MLQMKNELAKQKQGYEDIINTLRKTNRDVQNNAREVIFYLNTQISSLTLEMQEELDTLRARNVELSEAVKQTNTLSSQLESERCELESTQRKVNE